MTDQAGDVATALSMAVEPGLGADGRQGVVLHGLDRASLAALGAYKARGGVLDDVLRVTVERSDGPDVAGRCQMIGTGLRLVSHFPFQPGLAYRATFDPGAIRGFVPQGTVRLVFCLPRPVLPPPTVVTDVFPSGDCLPDNLLRFYVCFSHPMRRGHAEAEIMLLGFDGHPASDVLYRPPTELWDPAMRVLTLLLDPGRLKRGVGPNRQLGSPLEPGGTYTLVVGGGMTDLFGRRLGVPVHRSFGVGPATREPVALDAWTVVPPGAESWEPLMIVFPVALDWAMLFNAVTVTTLAGQPVHGCVAVDKMETRWRFTPDVPWAAGAYQVQIDYGLEDPCGNTLLAAFDRPIRTARQACHEVRAGTLSFVVA